MVAVAKPLDEGKDETLERGDPGFRELHASWEAFDTSGADPFTAEIVPNVPEPVSVPSLRPVNTGYISSGFGLRRHPVFGRRKQHGGIDIAAPTGTPVYATADGVVSRADRSRSYGLVIYLDHGAEMQTRYAHLSRMVVEDGQDVSKGDLIGYVGSTGRSTGPHLHYEIRMDGVAVDPSGYMNDRIQLADAPAGSRVFGAGGRKRPGVELGRGGE